MADKNSPGNGSDGEQSNGDSRIVPGGNALSPVLAASWERSMKHGFRREDRALFNTNVSSVMAKRVADENRGLLTHASPEMIKLYEGLGSARWLALCIDASGHIVCFVGDRSAAPRSLQVLMQPGRVLLESELGTTAPGCAIEDLRPVVVSRGEHYLTELEQFFCASAPILGPDGKLAGALDITSVDMRAVPLAGDMITFAVRRIENSMVAAKQNCALLHFHCDERLIGTPFEGIIAVDADGVIVGANRAAGQLLLLPGDFGVGTCLDSILEGGIDALRRRTRASDEQSISVQSEAGALALRLTERVREASRLASASTHYSRGPDEKHGFIVTDTRLLASLDTAVRIARTGLPVIITGETGTGKEIFARALHRAVRPNGPFLALNCAAIPEGLIEAELFGYVDGAFTGGRKGGAPGKIEQAHRGALLLDEIGDMPTTLQGRLLRVLQERTVTRIGDSRETPVDLLVICATHRELEKLMAEGRFREDLYYRLNGATIHLPPLRERTDIDAVIDGLLRRWSGAPDSAGADEFLTAAARDCLKKFPWPGNVRQLEQVLRSMLALHHDDIILDVADLPAPIRESADRPPQAAAAPIPESQLLLAAQIEAIRSALRDHNGNVSSAARALGISRGTLYNKMSRFGLSAGKTRSDNRD